PAPRGRRGTARADRAGARHRAARRCHSRPSLPTRQWRADMTLCIGIIGSGYMGRTYTECVARHNSGARLVAVAGGTRAPGLAADYGIAAEPSVDALVARADVDAV